MSQQLFFQFDAYNDPDDNYTAEVEADQVSGVSTAIVDVVDGKARSARVDQFYHRDGFLRLDCSEDLPPLVVAAALLAALQVAADHLDKSYGVVTQTQASQR